MKNRIGIRLEDKNPWERRVALTPEDAAKLISRGLDLTVEPFDRRAFPDQAYAEAGARISHEAVDADLVIGIKEMPTDLFKAGKAYLFFSHTIKGQPYNMDMLRRLMDLSCTLFDYETITDEGGQRLVAFGRHAGLAGMVDTLWTLGHRLVALGHPTPLSELRPTHEYADATEAMAAVARAGEALLAEASWPAEITPLVIGITGYGRVAGGAWEILEHLPHTKVSPDALEARVAEGRREILAVEFREEHLVEPHAPDESFDLQDYYTRGKEGYTSILDQHLPHLTVLVNGIYWEERFPRLAGVKVLRKLFHGASPRLLAVGDISCDVDGSLACTVRDTMPGDPVYVYDPHTGDAPSGLVAEGLAVMAVTNLPTELPVDASRAFSQALTPLIPGLADADLSAATVEEAGLPGPMQRAAILWRGQLTAPYAYMAEFLTE
ncbi:MAG: hypothetical protein JXX28_03470 [Deltaproteobacteria bacterium]|nr:hypothetical protein [Deltaproteobacteria bacterium]